MVERISSPKTLFQAIKDTKDASFRMIVGSGKYSEAYFKQNAKQKKHKIQLKKVYKKERKGYDTYQKRETVSYPYKKEEQSKQVEKPLLYSFIEETGEEEATASIFEKRELKSENIQSLIFSISSELRRNKKLSKVEKDKLNKTMKMLLTEKKLLEIKGTENIEREVYAAHFDSVTSFEDYNERKAFKQGLKEAIAFGDGELNVKKYNSELDIAITNINKYYYMLEHAKKEDYEFWSGRMTHYIESNQQALGTLFYKEELQIQVKEDGKTKQQLLDEKMDKLKEIRQRTNTYGKLKQEIELKKEKGEKVSIVEEMRLKMFEKNPFFEEKEEKNKNLQNKNDFHF